MFTDCFEIACIEIPFAFLYQIWPICFKSQNPYTANSERMTLGHHLLQSIYSVKLQ